MELQLLPTLDSNMRTWLSAHCRSQFFIIRHFDCYIMKTSKCIFHYVTQEQVKQERRAGNSLAITVGRYE